MGMSGGGGGVQQLAAQMPGYGPGEPSNMNYGQGGNYNSLAQDMSRNVQGQMQAQQQGPTSFGGGMGFQYNPSAGNYSNNMPGALGGPPQAQPGMMSAGGSPGWAGGQGRGGGGMGMGGRYGGGMMGGGGMGGYSPYGSPYQSNQYGFGSSYSPFQGQGGRYGQQGGQPQQMQGPYGGGGYC